MVTFLCMQMSLITQWIVYGYISVYANVIDNTVDSPDEGPTWWERPGPHFEATFPGTLFHPISVSVKPCPRCIPLQQHLGLILGWCERQVPLRDIYNPVFDNNACCQCWMPGCTCCAVEQEALKIAARGCDLIFKLPAYLPFAVQ